MKKFTLLILILTASSVADDAELPMNLALSVAKAQRNWLVVSMSPVVRQAQDEVTAAAGAAQAWCAARGMVFDPQSIACKTEKTNADRHE